MSQIVVTVKYNETRKDLALPQNISGKLLAQAVANVLEAPARPGQFFYLLTRAGKETTIIPADRTLSSAGVLFGDILELASGEAQVEVPTSQSTPTLLSKDGKAFPLKGSATLIGRRSPNIQVDIDLTALDGERLLSRRHATILQKKDGYYVADEGSTNGTWIDGKKLPPHQDQALLDGTAIQFGGPGGPVLTFTSKH